MLINKRQSTPSPIRKTTILAPLEQILSSDLDHGQSTHTMGQRGKYIPFGRKRRNTAIELKTRTPHRYTLAKPFVQICPHHGDSNRINSRLYSLTKEPRSLPTHAIGARNPPRQPTTHVAMILCSPGCAVCASWSSPTSREKLAIRE